MADVSARDDFVSALPHLRIAREGAGLFGTRCGSCDTIVEGERMACPACGSRTQLSFERFALTGTVHAHTVVHRSYPGVATPFVSVIVDLDGGGSLRGTLREVDPLAPLPVPLRVNMRFIDSGQTDPQDRPFLCYDFVPERIEA